MQLERVVLLGQGVPEHLLHLLLGAVAEHDDGLAARALIGQRELAEDDDAFLAPAQDQGVATLRRGGFALLNLLERTADALGDEANHHRKNDHPSQARKEADDLSKGTARTTMSSF